MPDSFDPYYEWLGIPPDEQPPNHYRLLGIRLFEANQTAIENSADQRMVHLRSLAGSQHVEHAQKLLNEVSTARVCLLNAEKKASYDEELRGQVGGELAGQPSAEPIAEEAVPIIQTDAGERGPPKRKPSPALLAAGGLAAAACVALVGWWLMAGADYPDVGQPPRVAERDVSRPAAPPAPPETRDAQQPRHDTTPQPDTPAESSDLPTPPIGDTPTVSVPDGPEPSAPGEQIPPPDEPASKPDADGSVVKAETPDEMPAVTEPVPEAVRAPVPDRAAQQQILKVLDDTFQTGAARDAEAKLALSEQVADMAEKAENVSERFVLLRRASELASEAGDAERMLELVAEIAERYEVDRLMAQGAMLNGFAKDASSEDRIAALVAVADPLIDESMAADRFDLADSLAEVVYRACLGSAGRAFRVEALRRRREVQQLRERWDAVVKARVVLASGPDDEAANTTVGHWYGFARRDWETALPHLAKGSDSDLKALARRELNEPPSEPASQMELADAWWDLAEASERESKPALLQRAAFWYQQAKPGLDSPVLAARVIKRLDELAKLGTESPEPPEKASEAKPAPARRTAKRHEPPDIGIEEPEKVPVGKMREHRLPHEVRQITTSDDGRVYAVAAWSAGINCWNTGTGEPVVTMPFAQTFYGVSLSHDGRLVTYGGRSPTLHVFDLETAEEVRTIPVSGWQFAQALSQDGKHLLVGTERGPRLWDLARGVEAVRFRGSGGWVEDVCFSGDERFIGTASTDKTARVHLLPTGQEVARFAGHNNHVRSIALSSDGRFAVSGGDDKMARLWDVASGRELHRVEHEEAVWGVAITGNGRYALSAGGDAQLWDLTNGQRVAQFERAGTRVALLPDNRFALTARGGNLFLWRLPLTAAGQAFEGDHETPP
ncbi:MAG: hypothetical protein RBS80_18555 [Thermoguttaceae bacterium]|jgi:hypothetical protein|nr:hypothetical protein [Thermoguttaceae bacterium]